MWWKFYKKILKNVGWFPRGHSAPTTVTTINGGCFGQGVVLLYVRSTIKNNLFLGLPLHKLVFAEETAGLIHVRATTEAMTSFMDHPLSESTMHQSSVSSPAPQPLARISSTGL